MIGYIAPFKILDYLDRLQVVKETSSEYHCLCPVCGDGGFKINKKQGSYKAFKCGCETKEIREAVSPWSKACAQGKGLKGKGKRKDKETVKLAVLPEPASDCPSSETTQIPEWLVKQGVPPEAIETRYWYSKTQWVSRFEWQTPFGKEKRSDGLWGFPP